MRRFRNQPRCGVAELQDAYVVAGPSGIQVCQGREEPRQALGMVEKVCAFRGRRRNGRPGVCGITRRNRRRAIVANRRLVFAVFGGGAEGRLTTACEDGEPDNDSPRPHVGIVARGATSTQAGHGGGHHHDHASCPPFARPVRRAVRYAPLGSEVALNSRRGPCVHPATS